MRGPAGIFSLFQEERECPEVHESVTRMNRVFRQIRCAGGEKCKEPGMEKAGKLLFSAAR